MTTTYKDRFTEAEQELSEKSAFICTTCKTAYSKEEAKKRDRACCGRTLTELLQESVGP